jgi:hypothetical protein
MSVARGFAALGFLVVAGVGCDHRDCSAICTEAQPAQFQLSCAQTNLTSVALSGVCATGDADPSDDEVYPPTRSLYIESPSPGECHVALTFATGFTYSADVTFTVQTDPMPASCHPCSYVAAAQPTFTVDNPTDTCVDAGLDAGVDAPQDAPGASAADAGADADGDG